MDDIGELNGLIIESYKLKIFLIVHLTILITKHLIKMNSLRSISTFIFSILARTGIAIEMGKLTFKSKT